MKRVLFLLLAVASIGLAAAGCGGGGGGEKPLSKPDYEAKMQALQKKVSSAGQELGKLQTASISGAGDVLDKGADLLDEAAGELAQINAPEDIAAAHKTLVEAAREAADKFRELAGKLKDAKPEDLASLLGELTSFDAIKKFQQATEEIRAKGYDIGGS